MSEEHDLETAVIEHISLLKRYLVQEYCNDIAFFPPGKYILVHPSDINSCTYSIATLHGWVIGRILRKLQEKQKGDINWPVTPEKLLSRMATGPLPEIYNAIYFSI